VISRIRSLTRISRMLERVRARERELQTAKKMPSVSRAKLGGARAADSSGNQRWV
jgi:hypothetical protein